MLKIKNKTDGKTNYFKNLPGKPMLCAYRHDSQRDRRGRDRLVVATTCATDAYHHYSFEFKSRSWRGVSDLIAKNRWFSPGTVVSSTNKTDSHDITEKNVDSDVKHHFVNPTTIRSRLPNIICILSYILPYILVASCDQTRMRKFE